MKQTYHPAAELFPMIEGTDFVRLCWDIREHGQKLPIVQHPDGSILDGRNRFKACEEMGIKPQIVRWNGKPGTEIEYVLSMNLSRRHLDTSQRAMVAAKVATMRQGERTDLAARAAKSEGNLPPRGGKSQEQAAKELHVGQRTVERAAVVLSEGTPAQIKAVESGKKTVTEVVKEIRPPAKKVDIKPAAPVSEVERLKKELFEANRSANNLNKSLETYVEICESDDGLREAMKEINKLKELLKISESRIEGLMNEKNELIKAVNYWKRKAEAKK